jgi:SAM-dependent methyltransferase
LFWAGDDTIMSMAMSKTTSHPTGNYTNALADCGYSISAIEPSSVMRAQAAPHQNVQWLAGSAKTIPLGEGKVDAVISTLAIHHFSDLRQALREMERVADMGPLILFTFDCTVIEKTWQADYFPMLWEERFVRSRRWLNWRSGLRKMPCGTWKSCHSCSPLT